jgi:hypothetical protein
MAWNFGGKRKATRFGSKKMLRVESSFSRQPLVARADLITGSHECPRRIPEQTAAANRFPANNPGQ